MPLTLVILAAGMGRRFGGPKQLEPLGPHGELLLDYTIYDARRAGFERVVLVIRPEMKEAFERVVAARYRDRIPLDFVTQDLGSLPGGFHPPPGREKPWGTAHAVLATASRVTGPFAVANADDLYGPTAYRALAAFLARPPDGPPPAYALVGFPLGETLSDTGPVNRARCETNDRGWLVRIEEVVGIRRVGPDGEFQTADGLIHAIPGDQLVSMNLWGFTPDLFPQAEAEFRSFLSRNGNDPRAEFPLPNLIMSLIRHGHARVRLLSGAGRWCGVTHPEDRSAVKAFLRDLAERGEYPRRLLD